MANGHCCHLKHLKTALSKGAFPEKAGLYWGLYFVITLVWTNTQNKCSGLEQHSQPIREWELQVHYWNNLAVKFYPEDNPTYFPAVYKRKLHNTTGKSFQAALLHSRNKR